MFSVINSGLDPLNSMANGNFNYGNVNLDTGSGNALRIMELNKKLIEKNPKVRSKVEALAESFHKEALLATAGMSNSSHLGNSISPLPINPIEAVKMLDKEIAESVPAPVHKNTNDISVSDNQGETSELNIPQDRPNDEEIQVSEVMKKNFDYGENDISKNATTNIFLVISNRYHKSGIRRLFDNKVIPSSEKISETDILKK
jgi:hypothetical protein